MKKNIQKNIQKTCGLLLLIGTLLISTLDIQAQTYWGSGSRDLYPDGAQGLRAYLRGVNSTTVNWPFANEGIHYVYAESGETLALASSVQGMGNARIRLFAPDGTQVVDNTSDGNIPDRTAELAGPKLSASDTTPNRYDPIYYPVTETGIYRVEFVSRGTSDPSASVTANANWTQPNDGGIRAWDVSVINTTSGDFVKGRVYVNILNLSNGTQNPQTRGFEAVVYALTKDGYTYRVDNNGNNGMHFTFFVNNNGFIDAGTGDPIYKSLNTTSSLNGRVHNPNNADTQKQITHKIFYSLPADDLPTDENVPGAVPGDSTWLKTTVTEPEVENVELVGVEGVPGQVSNKGGYVEFDADTQGNYNILIEPQNPGDFLPRTLTGSATAGHNQIPWDGNAGTAADPQAPGDPLPAQTVPVKVTVQLQGAEVHFPFFDMEYNINGFILELLDHTQLELPTPVEDVVSDIIYWDDTDISFTPGGNRGTASDPKDNSHLPPTSSTGISSNTNGHIWGIGGSGTSNQFGDNKSIDTWTFIKGEAVTINTDVEVREADLEVTAITSDKSSVFRGENITFTVKVRNNGPSEVEESPFWLVLPDGFEEAGVAYGFDGNTCGSESTTLVYDAAEGRFVSELNLPADCEVTYTITVTVTDAAASGDHDFDGTILRPNDVTDPDATNPDPNIPPTDPYYECTNNGLGGNCNNIKTATVEVKDTSALITNPMIRQKAKN